MKIGAMLGNQQKELRIAVEAMHKANKKRVKKYRKELISKGLPLGTRVNSPGKLIRYKDGKKVIR